MQDKEAFGQALTKAVSALQGTMIIRLPGDRSREHGASVEQLWKYTMFVCYLLREANKYNRWWLDAKGNPAMVLDLSKIRQYSYDTAHVGYTLGLSYHLHSILPENSSSWLMQDDGKCMYEVNRAMDGLTCFIDDGVYQAGKTESPAKLKDRTIASKPVASKEAKSVREPETVDKTVKAVKEASPKVAVEAEADKKPATASGTSKSSVKNKSGSQSKSAVEGEKSVVDIKTGKLADKAVKKSSNGNSGNVKKTNSGRKPGVKKKVVAKREGSENKDNKSARSGVKVKQSSVKDTAVDTNEFLDWLHAVWLKNGGKWEYTLEGGKAFVYHSTCTAYIAEKGLKIKPNDIAKALKQEGYHSITLDGTMCIALPEIENV